MASRPSSPGKIENETGDDFILGSETDITSASFTGLVTGNAPILGEVVVEIYRLFPNDSDTARTIQVPTRQNTPFGRRVRKSRHGCRGPKFLNDRIGEFYGRQFRFGRNPSVSESKDPR